MPTVSLMPVPIHQFFGNDGLPLIGGHLYTYAPGQPGVPKSTFLDSTGTYYNSNPVILDSSGRASIWLDGYYYMELWTGDENDVASTLIWSQDNVSTVQVSDVFATPLDNSVSAVKLTTNSVIESKIANGVVTAAKLATDAVETVKIKDLNVTEQKIANGAVTADKLAIGSVTIDKLATTITSVFANRLVNSNGFICQRTNNLISLADTDYTTDMWYGLTQTGTITSSTPTTFTGTTYTQSQVTAQRFGFAQVIENASVVDLRGKPCVFAAKVKQVSSGPKNIRCAIIAWTGTADTVARELVSSWTSSTFTTAGFFLGTNKTLVATTATSVLSNTDTDIFCTGTIPANANNIFCFVWTEAVAAQTDTLGFSWSSFEEGVGIPPVSFRPYSVDLAMCQRFYNQLYVSQYGYNGIVGPTNHLSTVTFPTMIKIPTITNSGLPVTAINVTTVYADEILTNRFGLITTIAANGGYGFNKQLLLLSAEL